MMNELLSINGIVQPVLGYLGPGGAITAVGGVLAAVAGIGIAILGFLWYPIRRVMRKRRKACGQEESHTNA